MIVQYTDNYLLIIQNALKEHYMNNATSWLKMFKQNLVRNQIKQSLNYLQDEESLEPRIPH
ncbi:MAG: hypothetical protein C0408_09190 [Odoribacter sp.]|nr:hypothetical protein [Odoribacter sp.]